MAQRTLGVIKDLRKAVVKAIKDAGITGIGDNVYSARSEDAWPTEESFAVVYTNSFKFDDQRTSPKTYKVSGDVIVDVVVQEIDDTANDDLDDMTAAVVTALQPMMPAKGFFDGLIKRFVLTGIENNLSEMGEKNRGCQRISFLAEFQLTIPIGGPTDDFLRAKNTISMGSGDGNEQEFVTIMRPSNAQ